MTVADRLARIRAAERATARRRAALPALDVDVVEVDGRPMIRVRRFGARVAVLTPRQAAALLGSAQPGSTAPGDPPS